MGRFEDAQLIEPINQPGELWFATAVAQFKFQNDCCQQVSGCCQRTSANLALNELITRLQAKRP